jgi:imidazolonepropionase-like amidohydrolase
MAFDTPQALSMATKTFQKAQEYAVKKAKAKETGKAFKNDLRMEILLDVLDRKIPAHIHCIPFYAIENAIELKKRFEIDIVIEHGLEADHVISGLHQAQIPISCGPLLLQQANTLPDLLPACLEKSGIKFSIHSDAPIVPPNDLLIYAAQAVRFSASREMALRAITLTAAEILRVDDRVGSIEPGKDADFVLLDGDPLDIFTHVKAVMINGKIKFQEKDVL